MSARDDLVGAIVYHDRDAQRRHFAVAGGGHGWGVAGSSACGRRAVNANVDACPSTLATVRVLTLWVRPALVPPVIEGRRRGAGDR
ncbi:MAG: hypothetical protein AAF628_20010 [Planctomycetota bacterium]